MNRLFLVGGSGFIGQSFIGLNHSNYDLLTIPSKVWPTLPAAKEGDCVLMLRAISSPTYVHRNPDESFRVNVLNTSDFVDHCLRMKYKVIFASSDVVYGETGFCPASETSAVNPFGTYARQKHKIEQEFLESPGFVTLRISLVTGEGSRLRSIIKTENPARIACPIYRNPIKVSDVIFFTSKIVATPFDELPSRVFNVGGRKNLDLLKIANIESKLVNGNKVVAVDRDFLDKEARPTVVSIDSSMAETFCGKLFSWPE